MKFLVIEDNEALNDAVADALLPLGTSDSAYDGEDGYFMAKTESYDLNVLDLMLPKMSGTELPAQLRAECHCPSPLIAALDYVPQKDDGPR